MICTRSKNHAIMHSNPTRRSARCGNRRVGCNSANQRKNAPSSAAAGNRQSKTNQRTGVTEAYTYGPIYQLTLVTQGASTTESYNRLSSQGVPTYSYNPSNQLTSNSNGSYTYDANGNTLSDASGKSYTWDFENRLVQAVVPGTGTITFRYDPLGRRIQKSGPLGTTNYLYDGMGREQMSSRRSTIAATSSPSTRNSIWKPTNCFPNCALRNE
jgi:YD repeat-containing protein